MKKLLIIPIAILILVACTIVDTDKRTIRLPTQEYRDQQPVTYQVKEDKAWLRIHNEEYICERK